MNLEQRRAGIDRRAHAEAGDAAVDARRRPPPGPHRRRRRADWSARARDWRWERRAGGRAAGRGRRSRRRRSRGRAARRRLDVAALERAADRRGRNDFGVGRRSRASTFSTISTAKPSRAPARARDRRASRSAPVPKWKSQPTTTAPTPSRATSALFDEFFRRQAGERGVEGQRHRRRRGRASARCAP